MKYQAIIFDADGVLIQSKYVFSEQLEIEYGIKHEKLLPFFHGPFVDCVLGKADLKEELAKVIDDWGWKGTVDELMEFWFTKGTQIDQDVAEYIRSIRQKGVKIYLATNQEFYRSTFLRKEFGNGILFDKVFSSAEIGLLKKNPDFFTKIYVAMDTIAKQRILFIDDSFENIESAKKFGIDAHLYTNLDDLKRYIED